MESSPIYARYVRRGRFMVQIKIQQNADSGRQLSKLSRQIPPFVTQPSVYQDISFVANQLWQLLPNSGAI